MTAEARRLGARGFVLSLVLSLALLPLLAGCGDDEKFNQTGTTQLFAQDYNPELLDILWVVNDRSPMYAARDHVIAQAKQFFGRLDGMTSYYRMALVTADMQFAQGALQPLGSPVILEKNFGTVDERAGLFGSLLAQVINLRTSATDRGFQAALTAAKGPFALRAGVPFVLVFLSDSDDHSPSGGGDTVNFYRDEFRALKGNDQSLLRAYSINLKPTPGTRCTSQFNSDIDQSGFENRYFRLASALGSETTSADLCGSFADSIDLTGLKLTQPKTRFQLAGVPRSGSLTVSVTLQGQVIDVSWTFDASTNEVVFAQPPPDGSAIQVTYFTD